MTYLPTPHFMKEIFFSIYTFLSQIRSWPTYQVEYLYCFIIYYSIYNYLCTARTRQLSSWKTTRKCFEVTSCKKNKNKNWNHQLERFIITSSYLCIMYVPMCIYCVVKYIIVIVVVFVVDCIARAFKTTTKLKRTGNDGELNTGLLLQVVILLWNDNNRIRFLCS